MSSDGRCLVKVGVNRRVWVWDLTKPQPKPEELRGHVGKREYSYNMPWGVVRLALSGDGVRLVVAAETPGDHTALMWNPFAPEAPARDLEGHENAIGILAMSADGSRLVSAERSVSQGESRTARLWELDNPVAQPALLKRRDPGKIHGASAPSPRSIRLLAGQSVWVYDLGRTDSKPIEFQIRSEADIGSAVVRSVAGHDLIVVDDETARDWDPRKNNAGRYWMALTAEGLRVVIANEEGIRLWNAKSPNIAAATSRSTLGRFTGMVLSADGRRLISLNGPRDDRSVRVWNLDRPNDEPQDLKGRVAMALALSADGRRLVSFAEKKIRLWHLDRPREDPVEIPADVGIGPVVLSGNGRRVADGDSNGMSRVKGRVWDLDRPEDDPIQLLGRVTVPKPIALSDDGRLLLATVAMVPGLGVGSTSWLWDLSDPVNPICLDKSGLGYGKVLTDQFCRGGQIVAEMSSGPGVSNGSDRRLAWELDCKKLISLAARVAGRNLTFEEWRNYFPGQRPRATFPDFAFPSADSTKDDGTPQSGASRPSFK